MNTYVAYYRNSTAHQGFEGQKKIVADYVEKEGGEIVAEFEEIASGDVFTWIELKKAVDKAIYLACPLIVSHPDRISRYEADFDKVNSQVLIVLAGE